MQLVSNEAKHSAESGPNDEISTKDYELVSSKEETSGTPGTNNISMFDTRKKQDISWSDINFVVKNKTKVLTDCWGSVKSSNVCAILGPSGSGKSSLLNVLAGRSATAGDVVVTGKVVVDGVSVDPVQFRRNLAYVMQDDALMATATPREALRFSAALRLEKQSTASRNDLVDQILAALGILECADTVIGNALIKGISGGQRKRTSVGIELISKPSLLLLDEPTSGLDSYTAYQLIQLMRQLAASNATILCTIHQPSSEVFHLFDQALFLVSGRVLYQGSVSGIVKHFEGFGYRCPGDYNPADFVMYVSQTETIEVLERDGLLQIRSNSPSNGSDDAQNHQEMTSPRNRSGSDTEVVLAVKAGLFVQLQWILWREALNTRRNVPALVGRYGVTIILSIIFGFIFLNVGDKNDANEDNFLAHYGVVTMVSINAMFGTAQPALLEFPNERPIFLREYATGTYGIFAYTIGKLCLEIPMVALQCIIQMTILYNLAGLQGDFIALAGCTFATGVTASSIAILLGCVVHNPKQASELSPLTLVPQILFSGFFIRTSQIPRWLRWAQYVCGLKYGVNLIIINEFASHRDSCNNDPDAAENCHNVKERNDIDPSLW
eukprot:CAMPEP_0185030922 /NCGR_PEP_ID=MMETSP1103-20130426/18064_1 /TAXON_ID=36769 /ORGANISM="Paraphysomonas bandaiensis, Strain Caron Lab Isolate" /LENGTH=608 /DNA_ID=CAMNT_0027566227 /DNA_START=89 /DNA_END=1912 /DNA_ORIENTATION=-